MALAASISPFGVRSEEHTSELQSLRHLVCRLLLEKKKKKIAALPAQKKQSSETQPPRSAVAKQPVVFVFCSASVHRSGVYFFFFFFNDTATTEIYTLSLHDALPIWESSDQISSGVNQMLHPDSLTD